MEETLLQLSVLVNRAVEAVKRLPGFDRIPEEWRDEALLLISWLFGILAVGFLAPDANVLAGSGIHPLVGTLVTGVAVATGANAINWFLGIGGALKSSIQTKTTVNVTANTESSAAAQSIVKSVADQQPKAA